VTHRIILCLFVTACLLTSSAHAGDSLFIRLVNASNSEQGVDPQLADVIKVLKRTLVFKSYTLAASAAQPLPAKDSESRLAELKIKCSGSQNNLRITVRKGKSVLLNTTVDLKDNTPLVLGGFPGKNGHQILIFLAR
jgi:hypothetical protein